MQSYINLRNTFHQVDPADFKSLNDIEQSTIKLLYGFGRQKKFKLYQWVSEDAKSNEKFDKQIRPSEVVKRQNFLSKSTNTPTGTLS